MKVCSKAHDSRAFGQVPRGSLWEADHEVVAENPGCFKNVKGSASPLDDEADQSEEGDA